MLLFKDYCTFGEFGGLDSEGNMCNCEDMYGTMRHDAKTTRGYECA